MRIVLAAVLFVMVSSPVFAQVVVLTTGETLGKGSLVAGETIGTMLDAGPSITGFVGWGMTKKLDVYGAIGRDDRNWVAIGYQFHIETIGDFDIAMANMIRFEGGFSMAPRMIVSQPIDQAKRFKMFTGGLYYMGTLDRQPTAHEGWMVPLGVEGRLSEKWRFLGEVRYGSRSIAANATLMYKIK
jgi:hypothetical protein